MPPEPLEYLGLRFSPDGNYLYFVRGEPGQPLKNVYRAPVLGGTPQKLISDVDTNITFSPDGRRLAYTVNNNPEIGKFRLVTYSLETGQSKTLVLGNANQLLWDPAWSPDGKTIICFINQQGDALSSLVSVDAITGKQTLIFESKDGFLSSPQWLPDGGSLLALYFGRDTTFTRQQIVEISYRDRRSRAVTHDVNSYSDLSLSADGRILATVLSQSYFNLFAARAADLGSGQAQQLTPGARVFRFDWTPDGQMLLEQSDDISLFHPDTGNRTPLTSSQQDGVAYEPSACANGRYVVSSIFAHGGAKTQTIWRMDVGGGNLKQLSDGKYDRFPLCSPDGKWVYYTDWDNAGKLTRVPLDGGKAERLSERPGYGGCDISPDGKLAAFGASGVGPKKQLALVPVDSPQNAKFVEFQHPVQSYGAIRFTHDGKAVVYALGDQDAENLWLQPLDGSPGKQITNFKSEQIRDFHWSFDGSKLGMVRGHTDSDVVLLEDSKS
jgi:Tol biopolymer transport system component